MQVLNRLMCAALALALPLCGNCETASTQTPAPGARWITLGTAGGPPLHASQAPISNALVVGDAIYLFDVGNSVLRQLDAVGRSIRDVRGVFLTHHHIDHNADLGLVIVQSWTFGTRKPLPVWGPPGTRTLVDGLVNANAPTESAAFAVAGAANPPLASAVSGKDLPDSMTDPTLVFEDEHIRVSAVMVEHFQVPPVAPIATMPTAVAYRIVAGGRSFVYTGDTGSTTRLRKLAQDADVLISEVIDIEAIRRSLEKSMPNASREFIDKLVGNLEKNHLRPEFIGELATNSRVKRVVLTHFVPVLEAIPDTHSLIKRVSSRYQGPVVPARDLDHF